MAIIEGNIRHSNHAIPNDVSDGMRRLREVHFASLAQQEEISRLAGSSEDERRMIGELQASAARARGHNEDALRNLGDLRMRKSLRLRDALKRKVALKPPYALHDWDFEVTLPPAPDPSFWWAETSWSTTTRKPDEPDEDSSSTLRADFRDDGLHFFGSVTTHDGDLYHDHFGFVALFELQPNRIPQSASNQWRSAPHVELFGRIIGHAGSEDLISGDQWAKCWMHRDQQIFQWGFGPDGPVPVVLGQAHEVETLIDREDSDAVDEVILPGFKWMPPVTFRNINRASSLWARLEVRFDIQTEGAGAFVWIDPQVVARTFQWPLTPL